MNNMNEMMMDDNNFIEVVKGLYLNMMKQTDKQIKSIDFTNEVTGNTYRLKLVNKTLKRFLVVKVN
jgi:hypothetical protein